VLSPISGEGAFYLGSANVTTSNGGDATFGVVPS
jgi:hypothetical protein